MSWLYTVVFTGLMFSPQESAVPGAEYCVQSETVQAASWVFDETDKFEQTYPLNANGRVKISNVNGSITVEAWDRNEVKLEYTKTADTKERLADVDIKIESKAEYFSAETDYAYSKSKNMGDRDYWKNGGKLKVEIRLMVPRGAVLNEIETVNGSVTVSNFVNITRVSAVNGSVSATNIRGTAKLSTVNGEVRADFDRLESGSKISLETVNGRVNLVIPSDANATVKADSLNGQIANDFGLPVRKGKYVGRDLYGKLGNGDVQIRLNSVNGALSISRKNDGKTPSPAVNLLEQKNSSDEDWDTGTDEKGMIRSAKIDREVAKGVREGIKLSGQVSAKVAAKALADMRIELKNIQPELARIASESAAAAAAIGDTAKMMNSDEMKTTMREAQAIQREVMARMADSSLFPTTTRVEKKSDSFPVKGTPVVTVNAIGSSVTVRGWDKPEVQYNVTQFTDARNREPINVIENHSDSAVNIKVENPAFQQRGGLSNDDSRLVRIEVFVPRRSDLKINASGEIRLEGVSGKVELTGSDETINVRDVDGTLQVRSSDGRIRVIGFKGDITARTSDGEINLEGDFTSVNARASDGSILLTLPENTSADIEASCENVRGEGIQMTRVSGTGSSSKYRIGTGGALYQLKTDGEIRVRGAGMLKEMD